ncbi:DUF2441 domain-containing protein [Virgibacillus doumboii]|uniref:DUF2441 domain-containing protein n=1 Tax=Virgibacillus doumboii TaxID=2697503 RepID=UPI0013DFEC35|nr:DUF2441 domain-containing protein [Virgibacillus doumboii]
MIENVTDKQLYHITRKPNPKGYAVGDVLETSEEGYNKFFGDYDVQDMSALSNPAAVTQGLTYYWHFARETAFEDVRKQDYSEYPSRQRCLWLSGNSNIDNWILEMGFNPSTHQILELNLEGNLFKCDSTFVNGKPRSLNTVRENARRYWNQEIVDENKIEYLFEGKATVRNIMKITIKPI